jgi:CRP/FNR family transcriptional regulator, cyclic AMP receptor protein
MIEDGLDEEQQRLLAEVDILEELPQGEVEYVATRSPIVPLGKKESLALGENLHGILLLVSGRVRVYEPTFRGQNLTFSVVEGRTVVAQTGFMSRSSLPLRVEALEASILRIIGWEDFENLVLRNPKVGMKIVRLLGKRLNACAGRLSDLIRKEVPAWLAGLILRLSEHQRVVTVEGGRRIPALYTHQQLASMVGSNREAVTRAFRVLKKAGAVETRARQIYVTDEDALERLAQAVR